MIRPILILVAATLLTVADASAASAFRAPRLIPRDVVSLEAPAPKAAAPKADSFGRLRVGEVRAIPKAAAVPGWTPADGGFVTRVRVSSAEARGLRVKLELGAFSGAMEVRAQGDGPPGSGTWGGPVEAMVLDPTLGPDAWTPYTDGAAQVIEIFSAVLPSEDAVRVAGVLHFTGSPTAKAAAACTLSTACTSGDATLDALIDERKKSLVRIQFVSGGLGFTCSATLIDTPRRPAAYFLTANHCIDGTAEAGSITAFWFYESSDCAGGGIAPGLVQTPGGMQLVFTNFNVDGSLLLMNRALPAGAVFSPVNNALVPTGTPVVNLSHPDGDTSRWATGTSGALFRDNERPYSMYSATFARGLIEGGSSGSGLFTTANGRLELRGILSQADDELSCAQPGLVVIFARMEIFGPQIAQYIGASAAAADDAPNRIQDVTAAISPVPLDTRTEPLVVTGKRIDYVGDVDIYRFTLSTTAYVSAYTLGSQDTVGTLLNSNGIAIEAVDDAQTSDFNTGITRQLGPGTYYFHVAHWEPAGTGTYDLVLRADRVDTNHTALWWNAAESGWGININHQGNIIFATLFTYEPDGSQMWLVMSRGERQPDGSYLGDLFRTTGPPFNASPWRPISFQAVGTMRLRFTSAAQATLEYTYNGAPVTKTITRQVFDEEPTCTWSAFDRSRAFNFQDLWWNSTESGWGVNVTHQGDIVFATLFTYAPDGSGMWLVLPAGQRTSVGVYSGPLYRTTGPAFNANPWTPISFAPVGTMTFTFTDGDTATMAYTVDGVPVTKSIKRQVFSVPKTQCEP